ncbi:MAG: metal-transporting ATPase [Omnitrophica WOR_2 bacterium GWC2_45_7]|nr:MAG: metal-transporting ATPase [Omnitrophica WOR_2 bacterium GWA2_45_18]OGX19950.1 MAG: metal-transporting ATPase [Omnitrophica WOR_2 bacterium GWC2_45_7]
MDCAEEIAILKKAVGPLVGGEDCLSFDVLKGKMTAELEDERLVEQLFNSIQKTGMEAVLWEKVLFEKSHASKSRVFDKKFVMTVISGTFLLLGFLSQVYFHKNIADIIKGSHEQHVLPLLSIIFYSLSIASAICFVLPGAMYAIRTLSPNINLLMTIAVIGAVIIGEWFEGATVIFLFAISLYLESWSVSKARRAIESLLQISPPVARYRTSDGIVAEKPVEEIPLNSTVLVRPGEKIALDGTITQGTSAINESMLTGEAVPVTKTIGDNVYAGTLNEESSIEFSVTKPASDTTLARIIRMVEEGLDRKAPSEQWVDKFARYYTPFMLLIAVVIATIPPLFLGNWSKWFYDALVLLVIGCPCALVISTPVSIVAGLTRAARNGILIKGGVFLEGIGRMSVLALDKTGTITYGKPQVEKIIPLNGNTETRLLGLAAALEQHSCHPLARSILKKAKQSQIKSLASTEYTVLPGKGAYGFVDGKKYWIGSHKMMDELGVETEEFHTLAKNLEDEAHTIVGICDQEHICGIITLKDQIRADVKDIVRELKVLGIQKVILLTGDNWQTAQAVGKSLGMDEVHAQLLPEDKVKIIHDLSQKYKTGMIGDGINDTPALASAHIGIAMAGMGTDMAIETADIALMSDNIEKIPWLIQHSHRTLKIIQQNIAFSIGVKGLFVILTFVGISNLWMAIAADMGATIVVVFNALRLLR